MGCTLPGTAWNARRAGKHKAVEAVKTVLVSVVSMLALYQVVLMAVGYGKLRLPFLHPRPASRAHRAVGDMIVVVTLLVALACLSVFGFDDGGGDDEGFGALHQVTGLLLLGVLGVKIAVVRGLLPWSKALPALGLSVAVLFAITWIASAGEYLL